MIEDTFAQPSYIYDVIEITRDLAPLQLGSPYNKILILRIHDMC